MAKQQRIRDPLHNLIEFREDRFDQVLWRVIQTPDFQRLRRIKQLGFSDIVYPGATHTRFAHSLGVLHVARQLLQLISQKTGTQNNDILSYHALAAALLHDIGHGPFSHAFEAVKKRLGLTSAQHEEASVGIICSPPISGIFDKEYGAGFSTNIANLIRSSGATSERKIYGAVVSSQFDADRLDYLQRDRLMTGTQLGSIDLTWLMSNLEVGEVPWGTDDSEGGTRPTFVLNRKAIHAAEAYILGLFQMYPTVYFHKATRSAEKIFIELLTQVFKCIKDDNVTATNLFTNHPLVEFAKKPQELATMRALDDTVILGSLPLLKSASDPLIAEFSARLLERNLFKCIDIREELTFFFKDIPQQEKESKLTIAVQNVKDRIEESNRTQDIPHSILIDEGSRKPYKKVDAGDGQSPLNQIYIQTGGRVQDLNEYSQVVQSIPEFTFFRAYISDNDERAKKIVNDAIQEQRHVRE